MPPRGLWGSSGAARHTTAESWLGRALAASPSRDELLLRYLAGFGPASVMDVQAWSGLTRMREVAERLRPRLRTFRDQHGVELFDLPEAPRPDPDTPAPVRFLPEYDNVLLGHADRSRVVTDDLNGQIFTNEGRNWAWLMIDGFARGSWRIARDRGSATLIVRTRTALPGRNKSPVADEGARLLTFAAAGERAQNIQFAPAG